MLRERRIEEVSDHISEVAKYLGDASLTYAFVNNNPAIQDVINTGVPVDAVLDDSID